MYLEERTGHRIPGEVLMVAHSDEEEIDEIMDDDNFDSDYRQMGNMNSITPPLPNSIPKPVAIRPPNDPPKCSSCGKDLPAGLEIAFCPFCGQKLSQSPKRQPGSIYYLP